MRHLKMYRAIRLIARHGSIRKAAEYLAISPSALNRAVQGFEDELGQPVFERLPGGVRLSDAGELLLDMIDRHLTEFEGFSTLLSDMRDGLAGTLRLSLGSDLGAGLVPTTLDAFCTAHPGVSVEVRQADDTRPLVARQVDLAVLTDAATDDHVDVLFAQPVAVVAAASGAPTCAPPTHLWDLVTHRLTVPPQGSGTRAAFTHMLRKHRLSESTISSQPVGMGRAAGQIGILPKTSLTPDAMPLPVPVGSVQIMALRRTRAPLTRSAQAFLNLLQKALDQAATVAG